MKNTVRAIILTIIITFVSIAYTYLQTDPFKVSRYKYDLSAGQSLRSELADMQNEISLRQKTLDKLEETAEYLKTLQQNR